MMLIEKHSADAMRYWAANSKLGTDTFFSEEELKISKRFLNKLYNASKFVILQLNEFYTRECDEGRKNASDRSLDHGTRK